MLGLAGDISAQGRGLLNQIDVANAKAISEIDEILAFHAFEPDPKNGTIRFIFEFADIEFDSGISPVLIVNEGGKKVGHVHPDVSLDETKFMRKNANNMIEVSLAPKFVYESELWIQFFPNTENLVTYKISFQAATVLRKVEGSVTKTPMDDFLKSLPKKTGSTQVQE